MNSLLDAKGLGQIHVERRPVTDEERRKLQQEEEKTLENAQALFKDQGTDTNERLMEV